MTSQQQDDLAKVLAELARRRAIEESVAKQSTQSSTSSTQSSTPNTNYAGVTTLPNTVYPTTTYPALATNNTPTQSTYTGSSIVDYLKSVGQASDYGSRATLATKYGISNYTGTAEQNTQLLNLLRGNISTGIETKINPITGLPESSLGKTIYEQNTSQYNPSPVDTAKDIVSNTPINTNVVSENATQDTSKIRDTLDEEKKAQEQADLDKTIKSQQEIIDSQNELAKLEVQSKIADLKKKLGITDETIKTPDKVDFTSTYQTLRDQNNVTGLENSINNITAQTTALQDSLTAGLYDEEGKLRPMELISSRQQEMSRQVQEKIATLNRSKENLLNELATKNTLISNLMNLKQTDYANAKADYETEYNKQLKFMELSRDIEEEAESDEQALKASAQANLNTIVNMLNGRSFSDLDTIIKNKIIELELKAGLPSGITQSFTEAKPDAEILTTVQGYDDSGNQQVTIIYKDPKTGLPGTMYTLGTGSVNPKLVEEGVEPFLTQDFVNNMFSEDEWLAVAINNNLKTNTGIFGGSGMGNQYDKSAAKLKMMEFIEEQRAANFDDEEIYDALIKAYKKS